MVIEDNKTIAQLKVLVAKELNVAKEQLCLVFHSTSLKDSFSLRQCGIEEGSVVRAVVKSVTTTPDGEVLQDQNGPKGEISATPFGLGALGGLAGLVELGFGSTDFSDLQKKMQKKLHSDPALMKSLLDNPVVKDIMSKPDLYGQLIASNPFMAEIVQENPEATEVLGNPALMKQMVSLANQPALLRELIDPKYKDFIGLKKSKGGDEDDAPNAKRQKLEEETDEKLSMDKDTSNEQGFMGKGTESLLKQMIEHSKDMPNVLQAPYVQSAINFAANNPEYLRMMMNHIPGVNNSEAMKKQLDLALPYFAQQLVNPEVQSLMCNPRALQAMLDVQEGLMELHQEVPGYFTSKDDASNPDPKGSNILNEVLSSVTSHLSDLPEEEKYATQLRHLHHMGFTDAEENLKILTASAGDINAAIIHHLQNQYNSQHQADDYQQAVDEANYEHQEQLQETYQSQEGQHDQQIDDQLLLGEHPEGQGQHEDGQLVEQDSDKGVLNKVESLLLLEGEGSDAEAAFAINPQTEE